MTKKEWIKIFIPIFLIWILDHFSKKWAMNSLTEITLGPIFLKLHFNQGAMLGFFSDLPEFLRIVSMSTGGAFLVVIYVLIQYLLPLKSLVLRVGMSTFLAGILGNVTDRVLWGKVVDFVAIKLFNFNTAIFNLADIFQWIGLGLILYIVVKDGEQLWIENNQRKNYWINTKFQLKYCFLLMGVGFSLTLITMVFTYTYLRVSLIEVVGNNPAVLDKFLAPFVITLSIVCIAFSLGLFVLGKIISHKMAGPIYAFEKYLTDLVDSKNTNAPIRVFKLRSNDEFTELESIAQVVKQNFAPEVPEDNSTN